MTSATPIQHWRHSLRPGWCFARYSRLADQRDLALGAVVRLGRMAGDVLGAVVNALQTLKKNVLLIIVCQAWRLVNQDSECVPDGYRRQ
jgi:hypothetical protein